MYSIIDLLSELIMYANPLAIEARLTSDQFIGIAQVGLILVLLGLVMIGLAHSGFPEGLAAVLASVLVLLSSGYLVAHGGNPFGFAEKACLTAGGIFRFVGGVGVAVSVACLLGMGRRTWGESRADFFNPVVIGASAIYGVVCVGVFNGGRAPDTGTQVWMALSIAAAWISFGGLHGLLRTKIGRYGGPRQLAVVAGGVMLLVLMSFVAFPGNTPSELVYSGCFPAGFVVGIFGQLAV